MPDWVTDLRDDVANRKFERLAILATDMKGAPDRAFLRRVRSLVQFPFVDAAGRPALSKGQVGDDVRGARGPH
jgi:hypothetical protein